LVPLECMFHGSKWFGWRNDSVIWINLPYP
jgi:hypothetical protein